MYAKILVGTDGSESAARAVRQAAELAKTHGAELLIMHGAKTTSAAPDVGYGVPAVDADAIRSAGQALLDRTAGEFSGEVKVGTVLRDGDPADAVLDVAEEEGVDLIVVGNRGMRGAKRLLLGSVPNSIAHHAPCDVLIVHTT